MSTFGEASITFSSTGFPKVKGEMDQLRTALDGLKSKLAGVNTNFDATAQNFAKAADKINQAASKIKTAAPKAMALPDRNAIFAEVENRQRANDKALELAARSREKMAALDLKGAEDKRKLDAKTLKDREAFFRSLEAMEAKAAISNRRFEAAESRARAKRVSDAAEADRAESMRRESLFLSRVSRDNRAAELEERSVRTTRRIRDREEALEKRRAESQRRDAERRRTSAPGMVELAHQMRDIFVLSFAGAALLRPLKEAAEFETLQMGLKNLIGTTREAKQVYSDLIEYAALTPFEFKEVGNMSRLFQLFGGEALNNAKMITIVGDAAAATGQDLQFVSFWVSRLYGLLKENAPIGVEAIHLQRLGLMSERVRKQITQMQEGGKATPEEMFNVFVQDLKRFTGGAQELSFTMQGLTSTAKDELSLALAKIGDVLNTYLKPSLRSIIDSFQDFRRNADESTVKTIALVGGFTALTVSAGVIVTVFKALGGALLFGPLLTGIVAGFTGLWKILTGLPAVIMAAVRAFHALAAAEITLGAVTSGGAFLAKMGSLVVMLPILLGLLDQLTYKLRADFRLTGLGIDPDIGKKMEIALNRFRELQAEAGTVGAQIFTNESIQAHERQLKALEEIEKSVVSTKEAYALLNKELQEVNKTIKNGKWWNPLDQFNLNTNLEYADKLKKKMEELNKFHRPTPFELARDRSRLERNIANERQTGTLFPDMLEEFNNLKRIFPSMELPMLVKKGDGSIDLAKSYDELAKIIKEHAEKQIKMEVDNIGVRWAKESKIIKERQGLGEQQMRKLFPDLAKKFDELKAIDEELEFPELIFSAKTGMLKIKDSFDKLFKTVEDAAKEQEKEEKRRWKQQEQEDAQFREHRRQVGIGALEDIALDFSKQRLDELGITKQFQSKTLTGWGLFDANLEASINNQHRETMQSLIKKQLKILEEQDKSLKDIGLTLETSKRLQENAFQRDALNNARGRVRN